MCVIMLCPSKGALLSVKIRQVIEVTVLDEGEPVQIGEVNTNQRVNKRYYDLDGNLLAENDITDKAMKEALGIGGF